MGPTCGNTRVEGALFECMGQGSRVVELYLALEDEWPATRIEEPKRTEERSQDADHSGNSRVLPRIRAVSDGEATRNAAAARDRAHCLTSDQIFLTSANDPARR